MDKKQFEDAVTHITAADSFKRRTVHLLEERAELSGTSDRRVDSHRFLSSRKVALAAAILIALVSGAFLLTRAGLFNVSEQNAVTASGSGDSAFEAMADPGIAAETDGGKMTSAMNAEDVHPETAAGSVPSETTAGCSASDFAEMNYSLLQVGADAFYVTGDGSMFRYEGEGQPLYLAALPTERVFTDGTFFYYSLGREIYQFSADDTNPQVIWTADKEIMLEYADQDRFIFRNLYLSELDYGFTVFDRRSGQSRLIFSDPSVLPKEGSEAYLSLLDVSGNTALFDVSVHPRSSLYTVNLTDLKSNEIYRGLVKSAAVIGGTVYFAPDMKTDDSPLNEAPVLMSVPVTGGNPDQADLSGISFNSIIRLVRSGENLLLATFMTDSTANSIYLFDPESGRSMRQLEGLDLIVNFISSDTYFTVSCLSPEGDHTTVTKEIVE